MRKIIFIVSLFLGIASQAWGGSGGAKPRYISLAPSTTEVLFALGLGDQVVAVSSYCNYPQEATRKPRVGDFSAPSIETIVSLKPDHIFCTGLEQAPVITALKRLGYQVYVADPATMRELFSSIRDIGRITGTSERAESLIAGMNTVIDSVARKTAGVPQEKRVKVFIEIWHDPLMTAGKGSFIDEMTAMAGGVNIAHDTPRPYCMFSAEKVVSANPGCIILAYMDKELPVKLVSGRFGWQEIDAVKNGRVFNDISPDILLRPGPRVVDGLRALSDKFYPEQ